jgi:alkaline phosphatase
MMFKLKALTVAIAAASLIACSDSDNDSKNTTGDIDLSPKTELTTAELKTSVENDWYKQASVRVSDAQGLADSINKARGSAKNIILFVGDGMGMSTVTAARILDGQNKGQQGEENTLSFGAFPFSGLAKTYNVDAQTPDSAGTMTALISGVKTDKGVIGVDEDIIRSDCSTVAGNELVTAIELAEIAGMSTGILSTARITHATPAAAYAKSADRNWEDVSDMPQEAIDAGCEDIASQLVNFETNLESRYAGIDVNGLDVVMGGGRRHFLPKDVAFNVEKDVAKGAEGDRTDGRDLIAEWKGKYTQGTYVNDQADFDAIDESTTEPVLALFNESHMQYEADRGNDILGEPSLTEMTQKAINILDNNDKGFFLTVESGRIDHGHHAGSAYTALHDTIEFANAIQAAVDSTNPEDTLILVTADHSHVFTISGYPQRGNPILGKVVKVGDTEPALAKDEKPFTTLAYANGRGFKDLGAETNADAAYGEAIVAGRVDLTEVDTTSPGFHQEATVPLGSETHSGEDVGVYASGPGAHLVSGTYEQSQIFHVMEYAGDLVAKADKALP